MVFFSRPGGMEENLARMELTFLVAAHIDIVRKVPVLEWMWAGVVYAGRVIPEDGKSNKSCQYKFSCSDTVTAAPGEYWHNNYCNLGFDFFFLHKQKPIHLSSHFNIKKTHARPAACLLARDRAALLSGWCIFGEFPRASFSMRIARTVRRGCSQHMSGSALIVIFTARNPFCFH